MTSFKDSLPSQRYLVERREGLSHARNRGLAEAGGDIVATCDDAIAGTAWVERMLEVWRRELTSGGREVPSQCDGRPASRAGWPRYPKGTSAGAIVGRASASDLSRVPLRQQHGVAAKSSW